MIFGYSICATLSDAHEFVQGALDVEITLLRWIFVWHPFFRDLHHREGLGDALVAKVDGTPIQVLQCSLDVATWR